jgi:glycerophosphoryl diester phosphodiesterase
VPSDPAAHPYFRGGGHQGAPLAFAHRGAAAHAAENTAEAFQRVIELGFTHLETDVRATLDGVAVAFHDETLDRITDRRGPVAEATWPQLRSAALTGGGTVARLDGLLGDFPDRCFNIDVKDVRAVGPLAAAVRRCRAQERVLIASFSERRLQAARQALGPTVATAVGPRGVAAVRAAAAGGPLRSIPHGPGLALQVPERMGVRLVDRRFVAEAHRRGLQVHVWTVNDPARMHALLDLGVDGLVTDDAPALIGVWNDRGGWPTAASGRAAPPKAPEWRGDAP